MVEERKERARVFPEQKRDGFHSPHYNSPSYHYFHFAMALRASTSKGSGVRELLFAIVLAVIFFEAGLHAPHKQAIPTASGLSKTAEALPLQRSSSSSQNAVLVDHPIPKLMADAEDKFRGLLARQSKTFEDAVAEYQRRYKRDPPKGFDDWYKFAVEKNVKLIDEFDAITEDLNPFWALSGEELRRRVDQVCQRFFFSFFLRLQCSYMKYLPLEELDRLGLSRSFLQRFLDTNFPEFLPQMALPSLNVIFALLLPIIFPFIPNLCLYYA